ncbi:hypothetical protein G8O23_13035 [Bacteroidales bacterium M08MB]|nr:hypothetical protein [Perlabentimonas gracilis]
MKAGMHYIVKKYFAIALVGIIGLLTLNNTLFMHLHRLSDGTLLVHAHPFSKSNQANEPNQTHQHTKVELLFFDSLLILFTVGLFRVVASVMQPKIVKHYFILQRFGYNISQICSNRAPPYYAF